ncbi:MAG: cobyrinate a,c-diamide synthase, partial [Chloroflexota bacterium]
MAGLVVAGIASGVGKTTVATGLMGALRRRGLRVQPFKAGPDYIDPSYHSRATGLPSRNLDTWMVPREALLELYDRALRGGALSPSMNSGQRLSKGADLAVVEGVMGLFDGYSGEDDAGSTAQLARWLGLPVLLVIEVERMARSAAAVVLGCQRLDPDLRVGGVVLNRVASDNHRRWVTRAIEKETGLPVLGYLPRRQDLALPQRHLGLIPTAEGRLGDEFFDRLIRQVESTFDLGAIETLARSASPPPFLPTGLFPSERIPPHTAIAVAQDEAFNFYYQDNLDLLEAWGARLLPFSPLHDTTLPPGASGLYLGGGFPELYAAGLASNQAMKQAIAQAAERDMPIYGECGGLMYLSQGIVDLEGQPHPMVGLVPAWTLMTEKRLKLRYVSVEASGPNPLVGESITARGHEFHWSRLKEALPEEKAAYRVRD